MYICFAQSACATSGDGETERRRERDDDDDEYFISSWLKNSSSTIQNEIKMLHE